MTAHVCQYLINKPFCDTEYIQKYNITNIKILKDKRMKKNLLKLISITLLLFSVVALLPSCSQRIYYVELNVKDMGRIVLELDAKSAPKTVKHFVDLVEEGFYDGLTFNRAQPGFVIQGGDGGQASKNRNVVGEFHANGYKNPISHIRGVISMARGGEYDSASTQFFICHQDARSSLDGLYAGFGYVVEGMEVVDMIVEKTSPYGNPNNMYFIYDTTKQAVIESARVLEEYTPAN